jgi:histidinol dehydrogenase
VAAVQSKKKTFKKKTNNGGSSSGGASSGNDGILPHSEQARVGSGLCFYHFCNGAAARRCTKPGNWSGK